MEQAKDIKELRKYKPLTPRESAMFCEQLAMILKSGILIHTGMQMMADDAPASGNKALYQSLSDELTANASLSNALESTGAFPAYMIYMIEIGSESGRLDRVLDSLSVYYNRQHMMRENMKSAVVYPLILIVMMFLVLIFLAAKVLPVFDEVFKSLGTQMSPSALAVMKAGTVINTYSIALLVVLLLLAAVAFIYSKSEPGKAALSNFLGGRKASERFSIASFTSSMAMMLSSGIDAEHSMELSAQAIPNKNIKRKIASAMELMKEESLGFMEAVGKVQLFTSSAHGILSMGQKSGKMDEAMQYIADIYEEEYQTALIKKVSLIEPLSIAALSIIIGAILISVMFPLLSILSSID